MKTVEPGIYKHWEGNLIFIQCLAFDRNHTKDEDRALVVYHPLFQVENPGFRFGTWDEMFGEVTGPGYKGPRYVKILDWEMEDPIIPGSTRWVIFHIYNTSITIKKIAWEEKTGKVLLHFEAKDNLREGSVELSRTTGKP